ncbi:ATP-binding protein [Candidatus Sumerlaeota bacterium]|nr:ATP-binding protein [Candidatus Sumerlaeota bacterium]
MNDEVLYRKRFDIQGRDFSNAGNVSSQVKAVLKEIGIEAYVIRRTAIAAYEGEMNIVMYADKGELEFLIDREKIQLIFTDQGPGIEDINLAMQPGYSTAPPEMQEMGFGAGMGLPNIIKNADKFEIQSEVGKGTTLHVIIYHSKHPE